LDRVVGKERFGSLKARVLFAKIVRKALEGVNPCLHQLDSARQLGLVNSRGEAVVRFGKAIGSGLYGDAFINTGAKGIARLLKFSAKVTNVLQDGRVLSKMSELAERGICQNMPITYNVLDCRRTCTFEKCPDAARNPHHNIILNELADGDLFDLFETQLNQVQYESIIMQICLALHAFHGLGYSHNDTHLGNFLYHKVKPGGYWRYNVRVEGKSVPVFVPNRGHLVVLWDPGMAADIHLQDYDHNEGGSDMFKPIVQMFRLNEDKTYKPIPKAAKDAMNIVRLISETETFLYASLGTKHEVLLGDRVFEFIMNGVREGKWLPSIKIGKRLRLPVRRLSMGRGSAGKLRTAGGRTAMKTRTVAPSRVSKILNPYKPFRVSKI